jgi:hypothetical protein
MPTHDFVDIGDVLNYEFLQGTIATIDEATDTCTVTVGSSVIPALLFWHGSNDDVLRSNGAISGAASYFTVGDSVIVMCKKHSINVADNKVVTGGSAGSKVWVAGYDLYGCLGLGNDHQLVENITPPMIIGGTRYEIRELIINGQAPQQLPPTDASILEPWPELGRLKYDRDYSYGDGGIIWDGLHWYVRYILDESTLPEFNAAGHRYDGGVYPDGYPYNYYQWSEEIIRYFVSWSQVEYTSCKISGSYIWACTYDGTSFLIRNDNKMFCCGGNIAGQLGIGAVTGHTNNPDDNVTIPNYYTSTFIEIPGDTKWKQVKIFEGKEGSGAGYYQVVWALDTDGKLWVTGNHGGTFGKGDLATFTKVDDTVWESFYMMFGNYTPTVIKKTGEEPNIIYEIYYLSYPPGSTTGSLALLMNMPKDTWDISFRGFTPSQVAAAFEGMSLNGYTEAFIGGSLLDSPVDPKQTGTFWKNDGWSVFYQALLGNTWLFTSNGVIALKR